jgi:hypothetical protein
MVKIHVIDLKACYPSLPLWWGRVFPYTGDAQDNAGQEIFPE